MAERVRVRRVSDEEGRQLQQIVRRGGKSDRSIVKWRRAMVVLASVGGNDVATIARLVQTSPDRVREMIHRFNDLGMRSLDPQWAGGRPRQITTSDRALIVSTAKTRPATLGQPFTHWSIRKLVEYLATKKGPKIPVSRERLRQILIAEGITFQRTKTWKESPDPFKEEKLTRIEWLLEHARDRTFAFDEFGPLTIKPVGGRGGRRSVSPNGCGRTITSRTDHGSSSRGTRSVPISCTARSNRARDQRQRCGRCKRSARMSMTANRSTSSWTTSTITRTGTCATGARNITSSSCSRRRTRRGRTRSRRTSGRCASS